MAGAIALVATLLAFFVPLAVPLFAQRWRTLIVIAALGAAFFGYVTWDLGNASGPAHLLGPFLSGLMLFGFAGGLLAKFVMLLSRR